jgi:DNA-directed RNA polymerase specialized sigma24 family protein
MPENSEFSADELMRLYLSAPLEENSARFLSLLIENHALPVIERSLRAKFQVSAQGGFYLAAQDFEDLCSESCLKLMQRLVALRNESNAQKIHDFNSYAATVAFNTWNEFLNDGAPNRKSLKNKIRYALGKSKAFDVWREKDDLYCGLIVHGRNPKQLSVENLTARLREEFVDFKSAALNDLLFEILEKANAALKINEIVAIVGRLWTVEDLPDVSLDGFRENVFLSKEDRRNDFEMRFELAQIWLEIRDLPVNQRVALLYNLRDERGREMLFVFYNAKIAALRELAGAMNLSPEECAKILPLLPLDDKTIAEKMGLTTKQVGNLRKIARENLRRRLAGKLKRQKREKDSGK